MLVLDELLGVYSHGRANRNKRASDEGKETAEVATTSQAAPGLKAFPNNVLHRSTAFKSGQLATATVKLYAKELGLRLKGMNTKLATEPRTWELARLADDMQLSALRWDGRVAVRPLASIARLRHCVKHHLYDNNSYQSLPAIFSRTMLRGEVFPIFAAAGTFKTQQAQRRGTYGDWRPRSRRIP
ncbi:hypothetical protein LX36DRAFT_673716 [Colletotrichum falcatum]|nr:hypothetical protein LX36DRAFT_673716 [Colletotrichum falcatum]